MIDQNSPTNNLTTTIYVKDDIAELFFWEINVVDVGLPIEEVVTLSFYLLLVHGVVGGSVV